MSGPGDLFSVSQSVSQSVVKERGKGKGKQLGLGPPNAMRCDAMRCDAMQCVCRTVGKVGKVGEQPRLVFQGFEFRKRK